MSEIQYSERLFSTGRITEGHGSRNHRRVRVRAKRLVEKNSRNSQENI